MTSIEEDKYGKKIEYNPLWKGPMQNIRFPTDRIWLIIFCIYLIIYIGCASYGFAVGDVRKLTHPSDNAGRTCGIDPDVIDKPYKLYLNLNKCRSSDGDSNPLSICQSPSVCVSQCPTENFLYKRDTNHNPSDNLKEKLSCTTDINLTDITLFNDIDILIANDKCARWYLKSKPVLNNCIASSVWEGHENETITQENLKEVNTVIERGEMFLKKAYSISKSALCPASVAIISGGVLTLIYVVLLNWLAVPFFYASICMFITLIGCGIYYLSVAYSNSNDNSLLVGLIFCVLLIIAIIIAVIYFRKKIYLACQLVTESSKAVLHLSATLLFPIIPCILYLAVVIITVMLALSLITITVPNYTIEKLYGGDADGCQCQDTPIVNYYTGQSCDPANFNTQCSANGQPCKFIHCRLDGQINPGYLSVFHVVNVFSFYWLIFFISGFEFMVLGGTFATWYWTFNKKDVRNHTLIESLTRTTRYHLGTIAVGSLILAIAQIIHMLLKGLQDKLKETNNSVAAACMCICRSLFDVLESFLKFLNYNAYIMCSIHGKSFFQSAKNAFNLIMRNVVKIVVVNTVADWLFFMAKLLITSIIVASLTIYLNYSRPIEACEDSAPISAVAIVLTLIGTFVISSVFFNVQTIAVNTIFLCFIEDTERNDGSDERPYYMSDKLKKLLQK